LIKAPFLETPQAIPHVARGEAQEIQKMDPRFRGNDGG
jgi:hypothetical protein